MAAQGGIDPVSAVANAAGEVVSTVGNIILADKQKQIEYQRWLAETYPEFKWFFEHENRKDNSWIWIVVLSVLIIAVLIATAMIKSKK